LFSGWNIVTTLGIPRQVTLVKWPPETAT
jgi:hypothetical protein